MDTDALHDLVDDLSSDIDQLEESLLPLINEALSASASKLPLLDKAKLYVLATYAIESILFSYVRLNGADAKNHPVFKELARVKEYFAKIKKAEGIGADGAVAGARLNKRAAERFIKHDLAGNRRYDQERAHREDAGAKRRIEDMSTGKHTRLDGSVDQGQKVKVIRAEDLESSEDDDDDAELPTTTAETTGKSGANYEALLHMAALQQQFLKCLKQCHGERAIYDAKVLRAGIAPSADSEHVMEQVWAEYLDRRQLLAARGGPDKLDSLDRREGIARGRLQKRLERKVAGIERKLLLMEEQQQQDANVSSSDDDSSDSDDDNADDLNTAALSRLDISHAAPPSKKRFKRDIKRAAKYAYGEREHFDADIAQLGFVLTPEQSAIVEKVWKDFLEHRRIGMEREEADGKLMPGGISKYSREGQEMKRLERKERQKARKNRWSAKRNVKRRAEWEERTRLAGEGHDDDKDDKQDDGRESVDPLET